jgi:hypothetical protein
LPLVALRAAVEVLTSVLGDPDIEAELVVEILDVLDEVLRVDIVPVDSDEA